MLKSNNTEELDQRYNSLISSTLAKLISFT